MSDRQTPESRLHAMTDLHASIVRADGSVGGIDTQPIAGWQNHDGSAARGAQYRDDQPAGVDNSQQAAQGCRVAAGGSDGLTDTCPLGTADSPVAYQSMLDVLWERRREVYGRTGKLPTDFILTPEEFCQLRAEATPVTSYAVFNSGAEFGYMAFGIPLRVVASAHGR